MAEFNLTICYTTKDDDVECKDWPYQADSLNEAVEQAKKEHRYIRAIYYNNQKL